MPVEFGQGSCRVEETLTRDSRLSFALLLSILSALHVCQQGASHCVETLPYKRRGHPPQAIQNSGVQTVTRVGDHDAFIHVDCSDEYSKTEGRD